MGKIRRLGRNQIPIEVVEQMWQVYRERQSIQAIAKTCGISLQTAWRYVNYGDPSRGIEPFKERLARLFRLAAELEDRDAAKALAEIRATATDLFRGLSLRVKQVVNNPQEITKIPPSDLPGMIDKVARLLLTLYDLQKQAGEAIETKTVDLREFREIVRLLPAEEIQLLREAIEDEKGLA